jgi:hypothetical protein
VAKYEIWGDDEAGKFLLLGYVNGDVPATADTILVRGQVREIEKVWRHHVGPLATQRVRVGLALAGIGDGPEPG